MRHSVFSATSLALFLSVGSLQAQSVYTFSTTTTSTAWFNSNNWTGGVASTFPGVENHTSTTASGNAGDVATFGTINLSGTTASLGMNFNNTTANTGVGNNGSANGSLTLGAIVFPNNLTKAINLGKNDSSAFAATLTLGGATVNSVANVILSNSDDNNVGINGFVGGSGSFPMGLALGNTTDNKIVIGGTGNVSIASVISGASRKLTKEGSGAGVLTLSGTNTYSGGTVLNAGFLTAGSVGAFGSGTVTVNGGTLSLGGFAVANTIVNSGGTVTGAGSYSGTQTVAGTSSFSGTVGGTVNVTGTLKGTATFTGAVTVDGIHAPGNSPGIQTFGSGLSYGNTSTLEWEFVGDSLAVRGTDFDGVDVTAGALSIITGANLKLIASAVDYSTLAWDGDRTFTIVNNSGSGSTSGEFALDLSAAGGFAGQGIWSVLTAPGVGGDTILTWTAAVPEPSTYAALAGLAVLGLAWKRRRNA